MPGHAGNLINRLISLSPETVPQVTINSLCELKSAGAMPDFSNRQLLHSFNVTKNFSSWQKFHRTCPDFANKDLFDYFIKECKEIFSHIVYAIHPAEFSMYFNTINNISDTTFYYISLDKKYNHWLEHYKKLLHFQYRRNEFTLYEKFKTRYNMRPIYLDCMLDSPQGFDSEYLRVVSDIGVTPVLEQARTLYAEWLELRGPNNVKI